MIPCAILYFTGSNLYIIGIWYARHVLDEHSPIVTPRVRRQIRKNGGAWPDRLILTMPSVNASNSTKFSSV